MMPGRGVTGVVFRFFQGLLQTSLSALFYRSDMHGQTLFVEVRKIPVALYGPTGLVWCDMA
jgi:hypothetical protein